MLSQTYKLKMASTPGLKVSIELAGLNDKAPTVVLGGLHGKYIMLRYPVVHPNDKSLWTEYLYSGNTATIRYIFDGVASGFKTELVKLINSPDKIIFLRYPKRVETYNLRRHQRVNCYLEATIAVKDQTSTAMIEDLSTSGCALSYLIEEGSLIPEIGDKVKVHCPYFTDSEDELMPCKVQRTTKDSRRATLGLTFHRPSPEVLMKIQDYVSNIISIAH
ncbi:PilZ domain-containing protein [Maridesulfovibrio bastinii]|uniref:PilZ domain-containing protein n=1 Tax=Maridesulfovibrio bastinii TaxID=47157 RepID=UPI000421B2EC|nr:PilZ domain-containing protein [Maridesulfovibrio bastinii]